jgi:hypothetical protein
MFWVVFVVPCLLAFVHITGEIRIYRRGGEVFEWIEKLDVFLKKIGI